MRALTIVLSLVLITSVAYTQENSSLETSTIDSPANISENINQNASDTKIQQPPLQPQIVQAPQVVNNQSLNATSQNVVENIVQNQTSVQPHSIAPSQFHSPPQNIENQSENQTLPEQVSNQTTTETAQKIQLIPQPSPEHTLQGLTLQQQQKLLNQQQLLQLYATEQNKSQLWKYANYTKQQLLQLQKLWQQQAKKAHQEAMQQMQERQRKEREQLQKMIAQQKLTKTQQISHKENLEFRERQSKFNPNIHLEGQSRYYQHHFNEYMFELNPAESEDFEINLVVGQTIAIHTATYAKNDGVYYRATQIDDEVPPQLQVYEDSKYVVVNQQFHFKKFVYFEGKASTNYLIRMYNYGKARLFSMNVVQVIDQSQIAHALTSNDFLNYGSRAARIYEQLKQKSESSKTMYTMEINNQNTLNTGIKHYSRYNLLELILVIVSCVIQVKLTEKLLTTSSIV